jgi:hypothetical protein
MTSTAFVLDLGSAYVTGVELQNAVDSAALAASSMLPINTSSLSGMTEAKDTAIEYAEKNNVTTLAREDITFIRGDGDYYIGVTVQAKEVVEMTVAKTIGIHTIDMVKDATVRISPASSVIGAAPISIEKDFFLSMVEAGTTKHLVLKYGANDEEVQNGAFGALDLDGGGGGSKDYEEWLANGYPYELKANDGFVTVETGNMSGATLDGFTSRYNKCTHYPYIGGCNVDQFVPSCPRVAPIPVVTYVDKHKVKIWGFAAFVFEAVDGNGKDSRITGSFVYNIMAPGAAYHEDVDYSDYDFGVYTRYISE